MRDRTNRNKTLTHWLAALLVVVAPTMTGFGQEGDASQDTYVWHGELVELDEAGRTITLRSRILSYADVEDFDSLNVGDGIALIWSGANGRASGIRGVRVDANREWTDPFTMPAQFVSTEHDNRFRYLTFRLIVDSTGTEAIQSLEPGDWVTLTSPHQPSSLSEVVIKVRPYNS